MGPRRNALRTLATFQTIAKTYQFHLETYLETYEASQTIIFGRRLAQI